MIASFETTCAICERPVHVGQNIVAFIGGWAHLECKYPE